MTATEQRLSTGVLVIGRGDPACAQRSSSPSADPHARYFGTELGERTLVPGADARLGEIRFEEWLGKTVPQAVPA